ncbi:hypothetical protein ACE6H2_015229 [Prunus campanulata]
MARSRRNMLVQSHHPIQHGCFLFILLFSSIISINIRACNSTPFSPPPFNRSDQAPGLFGITAKVRFGAFDRKVPPDGNTAGGGIIA